MRVIVGLGNPGREYEKTPHNVGFAVLDQIASRLSCSFRRSLRFPLRTAKAAFGGEDLLLVKPQTYMNNSGSAVWPVLSRRGLGPADLIVALDDADLPAWQIRIRKKGGSGGHKGLESLIGVLGSEDFIRLRVGIGRGEGDASLRGHVLRPLSGEAWETMQEAAARAAEAVFCILERSVESAMNHYNVSGS